MKVTFLKSFSSSMEQLCQGEALVEEDVSLPKTNKETSLALEAFSSGKKFWMEGVAFPTCFLFFLPIQENSGFVWIRCLTVRWLIVVSG